MSQPSASETILAVVAPQAGDASVLAVTPRRRPTLEAGQMRVRTAAAGLNFIEIYQRSGVYQVPYPFTPGTEASGTVIEVAPDVTRFAVGDRVMTAAAIGGTYAEEFIVSAAEAAAVPDGVDLVEAAAIPLQGATAHYLANSSANPQAGETVLVHAGAGGVGLILTQLLTNRGVRVITTASSPEKQQLSRDAGAVASVNYDSFLEHVRELTDGAGVSVVYDGVGKDTFDRSLDALAVRGTLVVFGGSSGQVPPFDLQRLSAGGSLTVTRPALPAFMRTEAERDWRYSDLTAAIADGSLKLRIHATVPLAEAARAHADLEARKTTGKTLLVP